MARSITLDLKHLGPASPRAQWSLAKSRSYCQDLTRTHYENFSVLSCFVPGNLLADFRAIYAFCRWADDLGDEISSDTESLSLLNWWQDELLECFRPQGKPWHPVHVALAETIRRHNLPKEPFLDLIAAFKQDRAVKEYESVEQLEDYCTRSANPVGRLVLHLAGAFTPQRALLSDFTCTGLQLANFWQDVARDRAIGRIYLPGDARTRHGVSINDLDSPHASGALKKLILELVSSTRSYFVRGEPLEHELPFPINRQISLFRRGGLCILDAIEQQQGDVLTQRPTVSKRAKLMLIATAALGTGSKPLPAKLKATPHDELLRSRAWCQRVARTQAGNFFPAFRLLPRDQFEGMCALYAFMRSTDDLADDPGSAASCLENWDKALTEALNGHPTHPCHLALLDAVTRFDIDPNWLRETIDGVKQDLGAVRIGTLLELESYCYKVASVVGLCCLAIWGANTDENRSLAIPAGYALQLTNILRDIAEDHQRDRIYIPTDIMVKHGVDPKTWPTKGLAFQSLYQDMVALNKNYYLKASELTKKLPPAGAAMFRGIFGVYRALLETMARDPDASLRQRTSLKPWHKAAIIGRAWSSRWLSSG